MEKYAARQPTNGARKLSSLHFPLVLQMSHGNHFCNTQYHGWHHVLQAIITFKTFNLDLSCKPISIFKIWRIGMLLSIRVKGWGWERGQGRKEFIKTTAFVFLILQCPFTSLSFKILSFFFLLYSRDANTTQLHKQPLVYNARSCTLSSWERSSGQWAGSGLEPDGH